MALRIAVVTPVNLQSHNGEPTPNHAPVLLPLHSASIPGTRRSNLAVVSRRGGRKPALVFYGLSSADQALP